MYICKGKEDTPPPPPPYPIYMYHVQNHKGLANSKWLRNLIKAEFDSGNRQYKIKNFNPLENSYLLLYLQLMEIENQLHVALHFSKLMLYLNFLFDFLQEKIQSGCKSRIIKYNLRLIRVYW